MTVDLCAVTPEPISQCITKTQSSSRDLRICSENNFSTQAVDVSSPSCSADPSQLMTSLHG